MLTSTKRDAELKEAAVRKAGGTSALARVLGVTPGAVSQWGRSRPIPRHVKPRLEHYLKPGRVLTRQAAHEITGFEEMALPAAVLDLVRLFRVDRPGSRVANLPRRFRNRYKARVDDMIARVTRELEEYQSLLEAEHRLDRAKEGKGRGAPGEE